MGATYMEVGRVTA